jgi:rhodanese-related sulfurtransferase
MLHLGPPPAGQPADPTKRPLAPPAGVTGPAAPTGATGTAAVTPPAPPPAESGWFISVQQAKEIYDKNEAIFIDARNFDEYREGHILGSMHIDKKYFDGAAGGDKARKYLIGQHVVIYCHGAECTDSEAVAKRLVALNLHIGPIHIIKDGIGGWQKAGYPVDKGNEVGF